MTAPQPVEAAPTPMTAPQPVAGNVSTPSASEIIN
jgi:hypothetical protein